MSDDRGPYKTPEEAARHIAQLYAWLEAWQDWSKQELEKYGLQLEDGWLGDDGSRKALTGFLERVGRGHGSHCRFMATFDNQPPEDCDCVYGLQKRVEELEAEIGLESVQHAEDKERIAELEAIAADYEKGRQALPDDPPEGYTFGEAVTALRRRCELAEKVAEAHKQANAELAKQVKGWSEFGEQMTRAEKAEAALAFYAQAGNYERRTMTASAVDIDAGARARAALDDDRS